MTDSVRERDVDFVRRSSKLTAVWIAVLGVASLLLLFYGDVLMELSTP